MYKTNDSGRINDKFSRHPAQLEYVDFLIISIRNLGTLISAANEWQIMRFPIFFEGFRAVRPYCDDLNVPHLKFFIRGAKLLQLPTAEWSHETS